MSTIGCYSSKGGVGKTSCAVNLAYAAALAGHRTLLIDLDQQGASSFYFRVRSPKKHKAKSLASSRSAARNAIRETDYEQLHILPANETYRNFDALLDGMKRSKRRLADFVRSFKRDYDVVIFDAPPTLSLVAENIFRAAEVVLVPVVPTVLSQRTFEQLVAFFKGSGYRKSKLVPFFSMVDRRKRMHLNSLAEIRASTKLVLDSEIPYSAEVESMGVHREPLLAYAPNHKASAEFRKLWQEIEEILGLE